ncbi:MAG: fasciclin domain-containing protein, partial [Glaciecola sp.]
KVDDANVITTGIKTSNGVIHVIDTVIMPKG